MCMGLERVSSNCMQLMTVKVPRQGLLERSDHVQRIPHRGHSDDVMGTYTCRQERAYPQGPHSQPPLRNQPMRKASSYPYKYRGHHCIYLCIHGDSYLDHKHAHPKREHVYRKIITMSTRKGVTAASTNIHTRGAIYRIFAMNTYVSRRMALMEPGSPLRRDHCIALRERGQQHQSRDSNNIATAT
jgi:hypothetical protein